MQWRAWGEGMSGLRGMINLNVYSICDIWPIGGSSVWAPKCLQAWEPEKKLTTITDMQLRTWSKTYSVNRVCVCVWQAYFSWHNHGEDHGEADWGGHGDVGGVRAAHASAGPAGYRGVQRSQ